ncbi:MAG: aminoacyl-tRNA hydrolase [Sphaerochaetaceae bacterium]
MIKLIVFLGNQGVNYAKTRHNFAWIFLDYYQEKQGPFSWQKKFHGQWCKDREFYLLKPLGFMNESGRSVTAMQHYFAFKSSEILVVHDDIELDFGEVKFQQGGGLAGHKGLRSLKQYLGEEDFFRLRLGVGRPKQGDVASFVLSRFSPEEQVLLDTICAEAFALLGERLTNFG